MGVTCREARALRQAEIPKRQVPGGLVLWTISTLDIPQVLRFLRRVLRPLVYSAAEGETQRPVALLAFRYLKNWL